MAPKPVSFDKWQFSRRKFDHVEPRYQRTPMADADDAEQGAVRDHTARKPSLEVYDNQHWRRAA